MLICRELTTEQVLRKARAFEVLFDRPPEVWVTGAFLDAAGGAVDLGGRHRQVLLPGEEVGSAEATFGMLLAEKKEPVAVKPAGGIWGEVRLILPAQQGRREKR
jgi:hypothetical protein